MAKEVRHRACPQGKLFSALLINKFYEKLDRKILKDICCNRDVRPLGHATKMS
jgi:hypothetical protein